MKHFFSNIGLLLVPLMALGVYAGEPGEVVLEQRVAAYSSEPPHELKGYFPQGGSLQVIGPEEGGYLRVRFEQSSGKLIEAFIKQDALDAPRPAAHMAQPAARSPVLPGNRSHMMGREYSSEDWLEDHEGHELAVKLQRKFKVPMIVFFYTDWNEDAQKLKEELYDLREFNEAAHDVIKVRVNPEHGEKDGRLAASYKLNKYPTTYVVEKIGAEPRKLDIFKKYFGRMKIEPVEHVIWNIHNDPRTGTPPAEEEEESDDEE